MLLWQERRAGAPEGYGYSGFCDLYEECKSSCRLSCAGSIRLAIGCSSTMPARPSSWSTAGSARWHGTDLRRRTGRVELQLGRGDLDADAARLDRRTPRALAFGDVPRQIVPELAPH